jgi:hypothetical protein
VLSESAVAEADDHRNGRPSGLHAKLIAVENGSTVTWFIGSANLTHAAFTGQNIEVMARCAARSTRIARGWREHRAFPQGRIPHPVRALRPHTPEAPWIRQSQQRASASKPHSTCCSVAAAHRSASHRRNNGTGAWRAPSMPDGVQVTAWPATRHEDRGQGFASELGWTLPVSRLTTFVAFRLSVEEDIDDVVPDAEAAGGQPARGAGRACLRLLIDTPGALHAVPARLAGRHRGPDRLGGRPGHCHPRPANGQRASAAKPCWMTWCGPPRASHIASNRSGG